jgi:hypothetical protein
MRRAPIGVAHLPSSTQPGLEHHYHRDRRFARRCMLSTEGPHPLLRVMEVVLLPVDATQLLIRAL